MLIHANKRWPKVASANLWPYALRRASDVLNETPSFQDPNRRSAQQIFAVTKVNPNSKHWKRFGCPVYVLDSSLQAGHIHHKWTQRSRVGIYIGRSPQHARSVALVLNLETGLVSPQFHVKFDSSFHTIKQSPEIKSLWQVKAGFVAQREPTVAQRTAKKGDTPKANADPPSEGVTFAQGTKRPRLEEVPPRPEPRVPNAPLVQVDRRPPEPREASELNKDVLQHHATSHNTDLEAPPLTRRYRLPRLRLGSNGDTANRSNDSSNQ